MPRIPQPNKSSSNPLKTKLSEQEILILEQHAEEAKSQLKIANAEMNAYLAKEPTADSDDKTFMAWNAHCNKLSENVRMLYNEAVHRIKLAVSARIDSL